MCADGPADDLDFYDLEFMGGLSVHNRLMYCRRKTNNLLRSWILFQEHIMPSLSSLRVELPITR